MLVLSRKTNQSVRIGPDIIVVPVRCEDGKVRLGISAPAHVAIDREEIFLAKQAVDKSEITTSEIGR